MYFNVNGGLSGLTKSRYVAS